MKIERLGEEGIRVIFGSTIDEKTHAKVRCFFFYLRSLDLKEVIDTVPSFRSCLIHFDVGRTDHDRMNAILEKIREEYENFPVPGPNHLEIPVKYGGNYGPDLDFVCDYSGLSAEEVIEIHSAGRYTVFAVGFMPGFPYMGTLDKRIYVPRLATPALKVPRGSVGLAQLQTGIYPFESPAGWRVIGRTMINLFDYRNEPYSLFQIGDIVRFTRS